MFRYSYPQAASGTDSLSREKNVLAALDWLRCVEASGSSLLCGVFQRLFLELLNSAEGLMGGPAMVVHQLLHQVVGRVGDPCIQFSDSPVIAGQCVEA